MNSTYNSGATTDAAVQKDVQQGSKWSEAEAIQTCWSSPTPPTTTTPGRPTGIPSPDPRDLSLQRLLTTLQRTLVVLIHPITTNCPPQAQSKSKKTCS